MSKAVLAPRRPGSADQQPHQTWTVVLASLGVFMTALDTLVVTTSLPVLRVDLHSSLSGLEWTVNAYNLAFACLLLTGAALGDRFGRRRLFTLGIGVFTVASAAAALAPGVGVLVAARAVQGAGAAVVFPLTLTLISEAFPLEKRGAAIGLWGGITGLAVAAGPVVGGAVVSGISWHWIFWLNVPVGVALIPLAATRLTESFGPRPQLDVVGLALAGAGAFGITWGLVRASAVGWGSAEVVGTLLAGAAVIGGFLAWERRSDHPMLPLEFFRQRTFASTNAVSFFMYAGLFGALFLMSQFLQSCLGYSPLAAGLRLLPWAAPPMIIAPVAGALADRYGNRPFMALGLALQAAGLGVGGADRGPRRQLPPGGRGAHHRRYRHLVLLPDRGQRGDGLGPAPRSRGGIRHQQHDPRAGWSLRRGRLGQRVRPPRCLYLPARVHRRLHSGAVGRGGLLGSRRPGRPAHRRPPDQRRRIGRAAEPGPGGGGGMTPTIRPPRP